MAEEEAQLNKIPLKAEDFIKDGADLSNSWFEQRYGNISIEEPTEIIQPTIRKILVPDNQNQNFSSQPMRQQMPQQNLYDQEMMRQRSMAQKMVDDQMREQRIQMCLRGISSGNPNFSNRANSCLPHNKMKFSGATIDIGRALGEQKRKK